MIYAGLVTFALALSGHVLASQNASAGSSSPSSTGSMAGMNMTEFTGAGANNNTQSSPAAAPASPYSLASIPGDMSTGKCLCPPPPSCAPPSGAGSPPDSGAVPPPPSTGGSQPPATGPPGTGSAQSPPTGPGAGGVPGVHPPNDTTSTGNGTTSGVAGLPNSVSIAGFIVAAASALVL